MSEDFDYIMFPVAFDISIKLESDAFEVERVYGSPGQEIPSSGADLKITSVFPSQKEEPTTTKGGVVLLKMKPKK